MLTIRPFVVGPLRATRNVAGVALVNVQTGLRVDAHFAEVVGGFRRVVGIAVGVVVVGRDPAAGRGAADRDRKTLGVVGFFVFQDRVFRVHVDLNEILPGRHA